MITLDSQPAGRLTLAATCSDNPIACRLLKAQLERVNLQVETTTNGEEAVAAWEEHGPGYFRAGMFDHRRPEVLRFFIIQSSLNLSDMPVCDGVEATRRIRELEVERGYEIRLPSKPVARDVPTILILMSSVFKLSR